MDAANAPQPAMSKTFDALHSLYENYKDHEKGSYYR
jgi:hypothetical protein